jgi:hypothetical protein
MTTFYVINAVRGEWLEVQAPGVLEARRESYKANPEWMGEWITTTTGEPASVRKGKAEVSAERRSPTSPLRVAAATSAPPRGAKLANGTTGARGNFRPY